MTESRPEHNRFGRYNDEEDKQTSFTLAAAGGCLWKEIYVGAAVWMASLKGPRGFPGTEAGMRCRKTRRVEKMRELAVANSTEGPITDPRASTCNANAP
jgi:hypothetical protein